MKGNAVLPAGRRIIVEHYKELVPTTPAASVMDSLLNAYAMKDTSEMVARYVKVYGS